jgi:hypothetical protein
VRDLADAAVSLPERDLGRAELLALQLRHDALSPRGGGGLAVKPAVTVVSPLE